MTREESDAHVIESRACDWYNVRSFRLLAAELAGKERDRLEKGATAYAKMMQKEAGMVGTTGDTAAQKLASEWDAVRSSVITEHKPAAPAPQFKKPRPAKATPAPVTVKEEGEPTEGVKEEKKNPFLEAVEIALKQGREVERTSLAYWVHALPADKELHAALKVAGFYFSGKKLAWYKASPAADVKRHTIKNLEEVR